MGKQVNFYMTSNDERDFIDFVRKERNVGIFKYTQNTPEILLLDELPAQSEPFWHTLFLWNPDVSPKQSLNFVKQQNYYVVDFIESEVIEFSRSVLDQGRLVRGGKDRGHPE